MIKNRGSVLIYVLTLTAALAAILVMVQTSNFNDIRHLNAIKKQIDSQYMVLSGQHLVNHLLEADSTAHDGVGDRWYRYTKAQNFPIDEGTLNIFIEDANKYPNLNQLITYRENFDPEFQKMFYNYAKKHNIPRNYINAVIDWIDIDDIPKSGGAEKSSYYSNSPSYVPRNKQLNSYGELRLIRGYREDMWRNLKQHFALHPWVGKVNVNMVSDEYLKALFPNEISGVNRTLRGRSKGAYVALGDFYTDLEPKQVTKEVEISTGTTYFNVVISAEIHNQTKQIKALYDTSSGRVKLRRLQWK